MYVCPVEYLAIIGRVWAKYRDCVSRSNNWSARPSLNRFDKFLWSFSNDNGDSNENIKKAIPMFRLAKWQLCMCITLFCTFLCRHCMTTTWKCLISFSMEMLTSNNELFFLFLNLLVRSPRNQLQGNRGSRKYPYPHHRGNLKFRRGREGVRGWGNSRGEGVGR